MTATTDLLASLCDTLCDAMIADAEDDCLTPELAKGLLAAYRAIDPTDSEHAAHIRDTIRDNTELEV